MSRPQRRRDSTSTSNFGVGRREGHDSSAFYSRFPVPEISEDDRRRAPPQLTSRTGSGWATLGTWTSSHATPTESRRSPSARWRWSSPRRRTTPARSTRRPSAKGHIPASYIDYLDMLHEGLRPSAPDKLEPGGRIAVNVANLGRQPVPLAVGGRHRHPAEPPQAASARRDHLAEGPRRGRELRLGNLPTARQSGPARPHRAGRDRFERAIRSGTSSRGSGGRGSSVEQFRVRGRIHGGHDRHMGDSPRLCNPGWSSRAVPCRTTAAPDRPLHIPWRLSAGSVHGRRHDSGCGRAHRSALRRLRDGCGLHRPRRAAHRGGAGAPRESRGRGPMGGRNPAFDKAERPLEGVC